MANAIKKPLIIPAIIGIIATVLITTLVKTHPGIHEGGRGGGYVILPLLSILAIGTATALMKELGKLVMSFAAIGGIFAVWLVLAFVTNCGTCGQFIGRGAAILLQPIVGIPFLGLVGFFAYRVLNVK